MGRKKNDGSVEKKPRAVKTKAGVQQLVEGVIVPKDENVIPQAVDENQGIHVELPRQEAFVTPKKEEQKPTVIKKKTNNASVGYCWNGVEIDTW